MTMIEKVARAQYAVIRERNPEIPAWEDLPAADRDFVCKHVRAGVEAMRDPPDSIINRLAGYEESTDDLRDGWNDAIDEALKEPHV